VREVWPAVLASTLTTVAVFLPVVFIREEAGQLYSDIAIAISASILMSMLIAITLVPAAAGRWLTRRASEAAPLADAHRRRFSAPVLGLVRWISHGVAGPLLSSRWCSAAPAPSSGG
jgi:multidrug efflux pump subunit AcrB